MSEIRPDLAADVYQRIDSELRKVIVGQNEVLMGLMVSLFANGHCLLIGVPGLAKTLIVKSLADVLGLNFNRIQFTPDLMPSDIVGSEILREIPGGGMEFKYEEGPVFTNLLLADEINRTPPKTQAALLESMQERAVTISGETRPLPSPFLVVATQNPIEHEGTYPLPEAQLDRFMFSLNLNYPSHAEEADIVRKTTIGTQESLSPVVSREELLAVQSLVRDVPVSDHIINYAVALATATRNLDGTTPEVSKKYLEWGAGPRASQYLVLGAKALALLLGKAAPEATDVRSVATAVLQHRVVANYRATGEGRNTSDIVTELVKTVPEPSY
ncbi:MAG: AAA family ATPase [Verrucomicrobiales bacterium]|nr:AAA family ATPase [Verrucomicrobiales bacterium]